MNPAQYKEAMRQRALERRVELERAEAEERCVLPKPQLQLQVEGEDSEGGSAAASFASVAAGGGSIEGLSYDDHDHLGLGELLLHSSEDGLSPLAPGPLADQWNFSSGDAQLAGFDQQADLSSSSSNSSNSTGRSSASRGNAWSEDDDELIFGGERRQQQQQEQRRRWRRRQGVRVLDWDDKLPGETSITQGVRLYLSNLYQDASHEDNCALFLYQILERVATEELELLTLKTRHIIKIEAFLRSVALSVPAKTWQQSVRGAFARTAPAGMTNSLSPGHGHQTQISKEELTFRMTLFVAMMKAERAGTDEADMAVDGLRVESVVRGYAANAAEILPLQRPARTLLPPLLFCMACEVLHVRLLAPEVRHVCRQIVSDYEARAKLWMTPAQNAERFLLPLVTEFASWLRSNKDILYQGSATEGLLRSIDQHLRSSLKNQVYRSPEHFLEVLQSFSSRLTDMPLPSYDPSGGDDHPFDISQTLKDVSRETFDVDREPIEPSRCWSRIRALLLDAAVLAQNSKQIQAPLDKTARPADAAALQPDTGGPRIATDSAASATATSPVIRAKNEEGVLEATTATTTATISAAAEEAQMCTRSTPTGVHPETASADAAAGGGGFTGKVEVERIEGKRAKGGGGDFACDSDRAEEIRDTKTKSPIEAYVDQCAWRVLHAASRTASGGDSFFVVQDLFGGEGVLVKMATAATEPIKIRTKGLAVRVTTVDKHDIYHFSDVDISSEASPRPLMTITTTMKEVILFAPFVETTSTRRKSGPTAEGTGSGAASPEKQQQQQQQPSHARSGRFITISAALPDYPEDHLDATAGVLHAQAPCAASNGCPQDSPPQLLPQTAHTAASTGFLQGDAGCSPTDSDDSNSVASSSSGGKVVRTSLSRRPSVFNSPPPAPTPTEWRRCEATNIDVDYRWRMGQRSPSNEEPDASVLDFEEAPLTSEDSLSGPGVRDTSRQGSPVVAADVTEKAESREEEGAMTPDFGAPKLMKLMEERDRAVHLCLQYRCKLKNTEGSLRAEECLASDLKGQLREAIAAGEATRKLFDQVMDKVRAAEGRRLRQETDTRLAQDGDKNARFAEEARKTRLQLARARKDLRGLWLERDELAMLAGEAIQGEQASCKRVKKLELAIVGLREQVAALALSEQKAIEEMARAKARATAAEAAESELRKAVEAIKHDFEAPATAEAGVGELDRTNPLPNNGEVGGVEQGWKLGLEVDVDSPVPVPPSLDEVGAGSEIGTDTPAFRPRLVDGVPVLKYGGARGKPKPKVLWVTPDFSEIFYTQTGRTTNSKKSSHMPLAGLCASRGRRDCPDLLRAPTDDRCFALVQADCLAGGKGDREGDPDKHSGNGNGNGNGNESDGGGDSPGPGRRKWGIGGTLPANLAHGKRWRGSGAEAGVVPAGTTSTTATTRKLTAGTTPSPGGRRGRGRAAVETAGRAARETMGLETTSAEECTSLVDEINELVRRAGMKHGDGGGGGGGGSSTQGRDLSVEWARSAEARRDVDAHAHADTKVGAEADC
eukprot:g15391.t2